MDSTGAKLALAAPDYSDAHFANLEGLLADPKVHQWLKYVGRWHRELLESAIDDCLEQAKYKEIRLLIDFDVLQVFLAARSPSRTDGFAIDFLFFNTPYKYALPTGAFLEFLDWLRSLGLLSAPVPDVANYTRDREGFLSVLAELTGVAVPSSSADIDDVVDRLRHRRITLHRLCQFLKDPRFIGVVSEHSPDQMEAIRQALANIPFRKRENQERRDRRDAMSLGSILWLMREPVVLKAADIFDRTGWILVSNSTVLLGLPRLLGEYGKDQENELTDELVKQAGEGRYPVKRPMQVANMQLLAKQGLVNAVVTAQRMRDNWIEITKHVEREIALSRDSTESVEGSAIPLTIDRRKVARILEDLAGGDNPLSMTSPFRELENYRATDSLINVSHSRQQAKPEDRLLQEAAEFGSVLHEIRMALSNVAGFDYNLLYKTEQRSFVAFEVRQIPDVESLTLMSGEIYLVDRPSRYFMVRWETRKDDWSFLGEIVRFITVRLPEHTVSQEWQLITRDEVMDDEALIVYTSVGIFQTDARLLFRMCAEGQHGVLNKITASIVASSGYKQVAAELEPEFIPEIQQIRLNTVFGDFMRDITPSEGSDRLFCAVLSHYNLSRVLGLLCARTCARFVLATKLRSCLSGLLKQFKPSGQRESQ